MNVSATMRRVRSEGPFADLLGRSKPKPLPLRIPHNRVYILPTRFGIFFGLFFLVMLLGALNYNNNMALILVYLVAAIILIAPAYTVRNLRGLEVLSAATDPVFANETAKTRVALHNHEATPRPIVWIRSSQEPEVVDIPATGQAIVRLYSATTERGWMKISRGRLYTTYPLGLFCAWFWLDLEARCLVYPEPEASPPPFPRAGAYGTDTVSSRRGDDELSGLRDYRAGDPAKVVAWKAYAHSGKMASKIFEDPQADHLCFDFATLAGLDLEARLSRLTAWVREAGANNLRYELRLGEDVFGPDSGAEHQHRCLRALALHQLPQTA